MVAASIVDMHVRDGDNIRYVPAALTVFRIRGGWQTRVRPQIRR
jgi:hypothetical protein